MGKSDMEPRILEEVELLFTAFIEPNLNQSLNITAGLLHATSNIISQLLFSQRHDYDDKKFQSLISAIAEAFDINIKMALSSSISFPFVQKIMKSTIERSDYLSYNIIIPTLQSYFDERKPLVDRKCPQNLTDRFIIHSETTQEENQQCYAG